MIKKIALAALIAAALPSAAMSADYTDSALQTSGGQLFNFSFAGVDTPVAGGLLTVTARGDFTLGFPGIEFLSYDLEGLTGVVAPETAGATYTSFSFDDTEFSFSRVLTLAELLAITADNTINVAIDFSSGVDLFAPGIAYAAVNINYLSAPNGAVPEPATWAMMIGGFAVAGVALRRRRAASVSFA